MKARRVALFLLVNCGLISLLVEGFVRLSLGGLISDRFIRPDAVLGHEHRPGMAGVWRTGEFENPVQINPQGLHDDSIPYNKPAATRRVLILGDSFVEALQVPPTQNFSTLLEPLLSQQVGQSVQVVNAGVLGYGTAHSLRYLETEGLRYQPDAVVYVFYANDVNDSQASQLFRLEDGQLTPQTRHVSALDRANGSLYDLSYTFRLLTAIYNNQQRLNDPSFIPTAWRSLPPVYRAELLPPQVAGWELVGALLERMHAVAESADVPLLVVYMPELFQVEDALWEQAASEVDLERDSPQRHLSALLPQGAIYLDLTDSLRALGQDGMLYFPNDGHLTPAGHQVVADLLTPILAELLMAR